VQTIVVAIATLVISPPLLGQTSWLVIEAIACFLSKLYSRQAGPVQKNTSTKKTTKKKKQRQRNNACPSLHQPSGRKRVQRAPSAEIYPKAQAYPKAHCPLPGPNRRATTEFRKYQMHAAHTHPLSYSVAAIGPTSIGRPARYLAHFSRASSRPSFLAQTCRVPRPEA